MKKRPVTGALLFVLLPSRRNATYRSELTARRIVSLSSLDKVDNRYHMTLAELGPGEEMRVERFDDESETARRLREMGLCRGAIVSVERRAPMGGPLLVTVRGTRVALRRAAADRVVGEKVA